jgi:acyl-CoA thioester hydrolase
VQCGLRVVHLGASSVRFEIGVFRNDEAQAAARGYFVHVCCTRDTHSPIPMPALLRAALERLRLPSLAADKP